MPKPGYLPRIARRQGAKPLDPRMARQGAQAKVPTSKPLDPSIARRQDA